MDETYFLESFKGRKVVGQRGGRAAKRGTSREQIPVLVARDRRLHQPGGQGLGLEHHAILTSSGRHAVGASHIQNVNAYHSHLKTWVRRFYGVVTYYLENYLGWFPALDRIPSPTRPAQLLALALGR